MHGRHDGEWSAVRDPWGNLELLTETHRSHPTGNDITHGGNNITGKILSVSYLLKPQAQLLLAVKPESVKIPDGFSDVFLYRATEALQFELEKVQNIKSHQFTNRAMSGFGV